jgi:hypothetical protein
MTGPRLLVFLNGLTAMACVLHVLVHATGLSIGEWHDYAVYVLAGASLVASVAYFRKVERTTPAPA